MSQSKTNVMRLLEQQSIPYKEHYYASKKLTDEKDTLANKIFKTLITVSKSGDHYVFMIPINEELDLKKAAKAVSEKSIHMIKEKDLFPLTGYVHGGCSPIGMKKEFQTTLHQTAKEMDTVIFSAGKVGVSVELNPNDLSQLLPVAYVDLIKNT